MIEVKVTTPDGKPIADAVVSLKEVPYKEAFPDIATLTDDNGRAKIACKREAGKYVFVVVTEGYGRFVVEAEVSADDSSSPVALVIAPTQ